jgi:anti-sigma factor RsiW
MKPENLETLLLERALGELPPATRELLEEYLARNPDAAREADTLTDTLQLARQAVALSPEMPQRPLKMDTLCRARQTWRWRGLTQEALRLAACAVLGLALGWYAHASRPAPVLAQTSRAEPAVVRPIPAEALSGGAVAAPRFWSLAKLQAEQRSRPASASHQESRYQLQWDSPMKMPRVVEDKL